MSGVVKNQYTVLIERLSHTWKRLTPPREHLFSDVINVIDGWEGKDRYYHNRTHLADVLAKLDWARDNLFDAPLLAHMSTLERKQIFDRLEMAIFYHDVVYNARAKDNEAQSRDLFIDHAKRQQLPQADIDAIARLIDLTANHTTAKEIDEMIMADCDLAILGADKNTFAAYDRNIRREYAHVPAPLYRANRAKVLQKFLDAPRLFKTDLFHQQYDAPARENLRGAITTTSPVRKILNKFGL